MAQANAAIRTNAANHARLVQEISVLGVIALIAIVILVVHPFGAKSSNTAPTKSTAITTTFDNSALQQTQSRNQTYPDVTPVPSDLGKTDPFAQ